MGKDIPYETTLGKDYIDNCFFEIIRKIRKYITDNKTWILVDEMTDSQCRFITNVILSTLKAEQSEKMIL